MEVSSRRSTNGQTHLHYALNLSTFLQIKE